MPAAGEVAALESLVSHSVWGGPHDETAVVSMHFDEGATAVLTSSVLYAAPSRLEVYGSSGYLIATGTLGGHGRGRIEGIRGDVPFTPVDPYVGELEDFVAAVEEGRDPEVSGPEGLRNVELLEWACP